MIETAAMLLHRAEAPDRLRRLKQAPSCAHHFSDGRRCNRVHTGGGFCDLHSRESRGSSRSVRSSRRMSDRDRDRFCAHTAGLRSTKRSRWKVPGPVKLAALNATRPAPPHDSASYKRWAYESERWADRFVEACRR